METPLRAIEMSDSSSLGINPSLAAGVHDVSACVHVCVCARPILAFSCFNICVHAYAYVCIWVRNSLWSFSFFFSPASLISARSAFWGAVTEP